MRMSRLLHKRKSPAPANDDTHEEADSALGDLPRWSLDSLYPGIDSEELAEDCESIEAHAKQFREDYKGGVARLSGVELGEAIAAYEELEAQRYKVDSYLDLLASEDVNNHVIIEPTKKWSAAQAEQLSFFETEILEMKEADLMTKMVEPDLAYYAPWIASLRTNISPLSEGVKSAAKQFNAANREAWNRLYHETMASIRVDIGGKQLALEDTSGEGAAEEDPRIVRQKTAEALRANSSRIAFIYNTMIKDDLDDAALRGYPRPDHAINAENGVDSKVIDTMFDTIKSSYAQLSHRFYNWKAEQMGVEVIPCDKVFDTPPGMSDEEPTYEIEAARRLVIRAFKKFSPKFARIAQKFFDEERIDLEARPDKETGGFAMPTGPANAPFILLTYEGQTEDVVSGLGHELGHGIHQTLAEQACGYFLSEASTAVSETASIFAEQLVFDELFRSEKDPAQRQKLLLDKVESMLGNGLQQLAYYDFEKRVYAERSKHELDAEEISDIWMDTQKQYWGPSVELDDYDRYSWMSVPHFFNTPFYVYSYSFAQQMVSALYQSYQEATEEGPEAREEFIENYTAFLETGMRRNLYESCQPFDFDPQTPAFWQDSLKLTENYLDELIEAVGPATPAPKAIKKPPAGPAL